MSLPEGGYNALVAGLYGVPVVFVAGDRAVVEQMRGLFGPVEGVAVKEEIGGGASRPLAGRRAQQQIRTASSVRCATGRAQAVQVGGALHDGAQSQGGASRSTRARSGRARENGLQARRPARGAERVQRDEVTGRCPAPADGPMIGA